MIFILYICRNLMENLMENALLQSNEEFVQPKPAKKPRMDLNEDKIENEAKLLTCIECSSEFNSKELLADHIIQAHHNKVKCKLCIKEFDILALRKHYYDDHLAKTFACGKCDKTFVTENMLKKHQTEKHELFCVCGICKQGFQSLKELGEHFKIHELQPNSLEKIHNKSFVKKSETVKKTNQSSKTSPKLVPKAHVCSICDETFEKADELALHVSKVHEETITDNQDTHNEVFTEATFNQSNLGEANSKARRKCDFCDKTFKSASGRATHMAYRPENCINIVKPREKPFGCGSCDKSFDNAAQLAHHVIITHLKSIFVCKSCKKYSSKKPVELAIHEKLCRSKSNKGEDS